MITKPVMKLEHPELDKYITKVYKQAGTLRHFFTVVSNIMFQSVHANFRKGGRPKKWAEHSPWTKKVRAKSLAKHGLGQNVLYGTGRLSQSIGNVNRIHDRSIEWGVGGVIYAWLMHHGGIIKPKKGKFLTLPFPGVTGKARDHKDTFFAKNVLFQKTKTGVKPLFLLKKFVKIPARPFMMFQKEDIKQLTNWAMAFFFDPKGSKKIVGKLSKGGYGK